MQKKRTTRFDQNRLFVIFDRLTFLDILIIWSSIVVLFGLIYFFLADTSSYLFSTITKAPVEGLLDPIYFSFITSTSTGFGDIVPMGSFKIISIVEVIFGLLLLAFVTFKLLSIKQDVLLNDIYELSFHDRVNTMRSSMLAFRQNMNRMTHKIEEDYISRREITELYNALSPFENILKDLLHLMKKRDNNFSKRIDALNTEILFNSVLQSFRRISGLVNAMDKHELDWRTDMTLNLINYCIQLNKKLFLRIKYSRILSKKMFMNLNSEKNNIIGQLKAQLETLKKELPKAASKKKK